MLSFVGKALVGAARHHILFAHFLVCVRVIGSLFRIVRSTTKETTVNHIMLWTDPAVYQHPSHAWQIRYCIHKRQILPD